MKKITLTLAVLCMTGQIYAQASLIGSGREYLDHSIWSQVFRDFEVKLTLPIITPWGVGFGSFNYVNSNISNKDILKEYSMFSKKDLVFREITNNITTSFLNFIPNDSAMRIRVMYKNVMLCKYDISQTDSTLLIDFNTPQITNREMISFDKKGNLLTYDCFNLWDSTRIVKQHVSDTLSVYATSYTNKTKNLIEKRQLNNGLITRKTVYKEDKFSSKESFVSDVVYKYNEDSKLTETLNLNKKEKVTDSISNYYEDGRLVSMFRQGINITEEAIGYSYLGTDSIKKELKSSDDHLSITYIYAANKLSKVIFDYISYSRTGSYVFEYNTLGLLITMSEFDIIDRENPNKIPQKQFMFTYDEKKNVKNIKMINASGKVMKEIDYEYDYL